jgi:hypothetical protein
VKALTLLLLFVTHAAVAALSTDPFVYDPGFNGGVIIEDRFAAISTDTSMLGLRVAVGATGDVIATGLVPAQFQSAGSNFGATRYNVLGQRVPWGNPTPAFSYFNERYLDYPNGTGTYVSWVRDLIVFNGYVFALVDIGPAGGNRDVHILTFTDGGPVTNGGMFVADTGAFTSGLDEVGAALVPYCYQTFSGGNPIQVCLLIASATYTTGGGRRVITMKRFLFHFADGTLTVDNSFGISNNGAMDQAAPDTLCDAGTSCSWQVNTATALRTDTNAPTLYLAGTVATSNLENNAFVIAVNGYDGSLSPNLGAGSGIYPNYLGTSSAGVAVAAATAGPENTDIVYLAANTSEACGQKGSVTKLLTHVTLPGGPLTVPDFQWGNGGSRDIGGNPGSCANVYTYLTDMILDGDRLVFVGFEDIVSTIPDPLFSIVRASDGALTEFARAGFPALHANGTPWGGASFQSVAARGGGYYAVTGYIYDAASNYATLFGTTSFVSDRIFGNDFE